MGYRDDFYTLDNIIGYTGVLHRQPTVYFWDDTANAYGHITQQHGQPDNVGRELYRQDPNYLIENTEVYDNEYPVGEFADHAGLPIKDGKVSVEWETGAQAGTIDSFHTSRGPFRPVKPSAFFPDAGRSEIAISICAAAIRNCPDLKPMYG